MMTLIEQFNLQDLFHPLHLSNPFDPSRRVLGTYKQYLASVQMLNRSKNVSQNPIYISYNYPVSLFQELMAIFDDDKRDKH